MGLFRCCRRCCAHGGEDSGQDHEQQDTGNDDERRAGEGDVLQRLNNERAGKQGFGMGNRRRCRCFVGGATAGWNARGRGKQARRLCNRSWRVGDQTGPGGSRSILTECTGVRTRCVRRGCFAGVLRGGVGNGHIGPNVDGLRGELLTIGLATFGERAGSKRTRAFIEVSDAHNTMQHHDAGGRLQRICLELSATPCTRASESGPWTAIRHDHCSSIHPATHTSKV